MRRINFERERRLIRRNSAEASSYSSSGENLENLGYFTLTKESTIYAVRDFASGFGQLFKKGQRFAGVTKIGESIFNVADVFVSFGADLLRSITGPIQEGISNARLNISRALSQFKEIKNPMNVFAAVGDTIHAIVARLGSDILRLLRGGVDSIRGSTRSQISAALQGA